MKMEMILINAKHVILQIVYNAINVMKLKNINFIQKIRIRKQASEQSVKNVQIKNI